MIRGCGNAFFQQKTPLGRAQRAHAQHLPEVRLLCLREVAQLLKAPRPGMATGAVSEQHAGL